MGLSLRQSPSQAQIQLVELTYDDGPDTAGNTQKVLDALNKANARATFYLVGKRVIQGENWRIVFDIAASGHWLGNHAFDWNDEKDNHIFLKGDEAERARKILITEWAIRDSLNKGKAEAQKKKTWDSIPEENRNYIDDVIAHGTGRFRTPGFKSKWWRSDEKITIRAIDMANRILSAAGLRALSASDDVSLDPKDWESGKTQEDIEKSVIGDLESDSSVLLHSRIEASALATPAILDKIKKEKWSYTAPAQGKIVGVRPAEGFADLGTISDPPTAAQVEKARKFFLKKAKWLGPILAGDAAISVFQLAQAAGPDQVKAFREEIETTNIKDKHFEGPLAWWMDQNDKFTLFYKFLKAWSANTEFPREGVTY
jgi:peptidoglycan/xylan/chitin deacetylase (PgdA/CDA1 family)